MRCSVLCLLLCAALVSGAPSLLPGDPRLSDPNHQHHHGEHDHGEHAHGDHAHGEHAHDGQAHPEAHAHDGQAHPEAHAHDGQAHSEAHAHDGQAHPGPHAHDGQAHPGPHAHDGQAHPGPHAHDGQAHPGPHAHDGQAHPEAHAHDGQAHPEAHAHDGQAHPAQDAPLIQNAFPEQNAFPDQNVQPVLSPAQGIPDLRASYAPGGAGTATGPAPVSAPVPAPVPAPVAAAPASQPPQGRPISRPSNPFLSGSLKLPSSSSFQVPVQPVPPPAQRPTPEPILEVNTNPLGGPAGPKGPVRASCPGPASALPCVREAECDPYTGFLKSDGVKLPYPITKDTPTVAIGQCKLGAEVGVCCKRFPRPASTTTTTALPLGVDYGQGLEHLKKEPTERPPNPFLPDYKPSY